MRPPLIKIDKLPHPGFRRNLNSRFMLHHSKAPNKWCFSWFPLSRSFEVTLLSLLYSTSESAIQIQPSQRIKRRWCQPDAQRATISNDFIAERSEHRGRHRILRMRLLHGRRPQYRAGESSLRVREAQGDILAHRRKPALIQYSRRNKSVNGQEFAHGSVSCSRACSSCSNPQSLARSSASFSLF